MVGDRYWYRHYAWYHWWPTTWQGRLATLLSLTPFIGGLIYAIRDRPGILWIVIWIAISLICIAMPLVFFSDRFEMLTLQDSFDDESERSRAFSVPVDDDSIADSGIPPEIKAKVLENVIRSSDDDSKDAH